MSDNGWDPHLYEFVSATGESLYVGKDKNGPHRRVSAHFRERRSWAVAGTHNNTDLWVRFIAKPGASEAELNAAEGELIKARRPKGNQVLNGAHYDAAWDQSVQRADVEARGLAWEGPPVVVTVLRAKWRRLVVAVRTAVIVDVVAVSGGWLLWSVLT